MDHFAYVVLEKSDNLSESLDESIFPGLEITETDQDTNVITIPLPRELNEDEQDEYANRLADYMFEQGHEEFDIYLNNDDDDITEVTYDGDDFFEEFGTMWYNDDDVVDEAEYQGRKVKLGKPMRGDKRELCAGSVAMVFKKMGGEVVYFGKPYPEVYNQSTDNNGKKILSIGDNLNTDIKGANLLNYDSLLISNGVHRNEIMDNGIEKVSKQYESIVNFMQSDLKW